MLTLPTDLQIYRLRFFSSACVQWPAVTAVASTPFRVHSSFGTCLYFTMHQNVFGCRAPPEPRKGLIGSFNCFRDFLRTTLILSLSRDANVTVRYFEVAFDVSKAVDIHIYVIQQSQRRAEESKSQIPLHGHRLQTPATNTTNGQAHNNNSTTNLPHRNARAQYLDMSRCWDVANFCPLVVFVGGVRSWCS